ncbi:flagellin [Bacillus sp. BHET2]|uniref:flagellin N-terminal helical domain-containing protein n=1 Tax=Bacillus sp. BHET2 TaxID=2583818 RepID=UPI00110DD244|nr:flagellin [Bacillus sp. BHET2]TMU84305.1 flagellin [Bacillus sp. BHET2]
MRINHNIAALNTYRQLNSASTAQGKSMEKLSSGMRINKAGDDAAGLAISEKMRGQIRGLDQASKNSQDAISMIQTAEGALNETHSILQRMRELSVQSANDTNTTEDRKNIQDEMNQLGTEVERIGNQTEFNTKKLLNGKMGAAQTATAGTITNTGNLGAAMADATTLDSLVDKAGNNVGIANGDTITATWSVNGTQKTATFNVTDISSDALSNINGAIAGDASVASAATVAGVTTITAASNGTAAQINGLSIEVTSSTGERKEAASNALSNFDVGTAAKDVRDDGSSTFHIGANNGQTINLSVEDMRASTLGVKDLQVGTQSQAETAMKVVDQAIQKVSTERSKLGSYQNRLEHTINNLNTSSENLTAAESRIRDVDYALAA